MADNDPTESCFAPGVAEALTRQRLQEEEERDAEREQDEQLRQQELQSQIRKEFADISLDLVESDSDDEKDVADENHAVEDTPKTDERPRSHYPKYLTSTPYVARFDIEEGVLAGDTPDRDAEERFLYAGSNSESLEVLYQARGHEIERLRKEVQKLEEENQSANRRLKHELALLKADNEQLRVGLEHSELVCKEAVQDNQALRNDIAALQSTLQKQEKVREEITARAEAAEHMVQTLQTQLIELQKKETFLRAKEHHEDVVSSLKRHHETEILAMQHEHDKVSAQNKRNETEIQHLRETIKQNALHHENMLMEKTERIEELSQRLSEAQRKMTELLVARTNDEAEMRLNSGGDPVKEILRLRESLVSAKQERDEQRKLNQDLADELTEMRNQLERQKRWANEQDTREELAKLRVREKELLQENNEIRGHISTLEGQLDAQSNGASTALSQMVDSLREELRRKTDALDYQQNRIKELIVQWEDNSEQLKANHGRDRVELEEIRAKYKDLKRKVRAYQKHRQKEREHFINENQHLREAFSAILMEYKTKMESAYECREKEIEMELVNLKHQFDAELEKLDRGGKGNVEHLIQADLDPPTVSLSSSSKAEAPATLAKASPENQIRDHEKQKKRSEGLSRIFEEATRDIRDQLKRPSS